MLLAQAKLFVLIKENITMDIEIISGFLGAGKTTVSATVEGKNS